LRLVQRSFSVGKATEKAYSFFEGVLDKTEKSGTVPADWVCANPRAIFSTNAFLSTKNRL